MSSKSLQPNKPRRVSLEAMVLGICAISIFFLNNFSLTRETSLHPNIKVNVPVVGQWRAKDGHFSIQFRVDKTLGASLAKGSEAPASDSGTYVLEPNGTLWVTLAGGKSYWATLATTYPDRFDLIDSGTGGVAEFERVAP